MKYNRCGHLFQERFKSENVEKRDYFLKVLRYIHQNPMNAGLASNVFENKWTSIHEYIGNADMIDIDIVLTQFSSNRNEALSLFLEFNQESNEDQCLDDFIIAKKSDSEVLEYLNEIGITNITMLQQMDKKERNKIIASLKGVEGISVRQLSRITGISKSVISRIR